MDRFMCESRTVSDIWTLSNTPNFFLESSLVFQGGNLAYFHFSPCTVLLGVFLVKVLQSFSSGGNALPARSLEILMYFLSGSQSNVGNKTIGTFMDVAPISVLI